MLFGTMRSTPTQIEASQVMKDIGLSDDSSLRQLLQRQRQIQGKTGSYSQFVEILAKFPQEICPVRGNTGSNGDEVVDAKTQLDGSQAPYLVQVVLQWVTKGRQACQHSYQHDGTWLVDI